jgi:hypothetical protein
LIRVLLTEVRGLVCGAYELLVYEEG